MALIVAIIGMTVVAIVTRNRLNEGDSMMLTQDLEYEGFVDKDESITYYVGNYYGWYQNPGRATTDEWICHIKRCRLGFNIR